MSRAATVPGWEGLLDEGEEILWQGRSEPGLRLARLRPLQMLTGAIFTGFSIFWMAQASWILGRGDFGAVSRFFPLFGLPFLLIGLYNLAGFPVWRAYVRRRSWYTLTNRNAFVATDLPFVGRRLKSYPITADTGLSFDGNDPATTIFAQEVVDTSDGVAQTEVGFERIRDGRTVFGLMRDIQKGQSS